LQISSRRARLIGVATFLIVLAIGVAIYSYYEAQHQELIQFLVQYRAYNPNFNYEALAEVNVDALQRPNGNFTVENLMISYTFNSADEYDSVPYFRFTYESGPPCNVSQFPSSSNCREMLLIIPNNNITNVASPTRQGPGYVLYAGPLNSFVFDLETEMGQHIAWRLYLFLLTYVGT